ncbi:sensor histidine kinase [Actinomadura fibrosa]|uniref:Anti-sigma factor RsbA family regulatory protein n=1 Tax=Actinomadura fibrosa TaxID=111802 RepID=A0ABW2XSB0_9ACTN|nr:sensor histidine kinase [Actinomadura fibrosa]
MTPTPADRPGGPLPDASGIGAPVATSPFPAAQGPADTAPGRDRDVLVHQALVYRSRHEFALAAVPYLRAGRRAGDAVVVIAAPAVADGLREQLGAETAAAIEFIDAAGWFQGPMQTLAAYYDRMPEWWRHGRLRLLAEPVWDGRTPLEVCEWKRHESILNVAFAATPTSIVCAYDASALPGHVVDDASRTHPEVLGPEGIARPSGHYTAPADFYAECNAAPLPPPPSGAVRRAFASGELPGLRAFLTAEAGRLGLPREASLPFVLAVNEVATSIIREGGGRGSLWVWAADGELICDVHDPGRALDDHFLGYAPPRGVRRGEAAMWAVRRLCHIVEIRTGADGTRVRMRLKLP